MKTLITAKGNSLDSEFDLRYGRAAWFCLLDDETGDVSFHENQHADASHGAGQKVAEMTMDLGASRVISGDFGPKAKDLLEKFKIQMVLLGDDSQEIKQIIEKLK